MDNFTPYHAWYQTSENPVTWSFGLWDGHGITNILATVTRIDDHLWYWTSREMPTYTRVIVHHGKAPDFTAARLNAELSLQPSASSDEEG